MGAEPVALPVVEEQQELLPMVPPLMEPYPMMPMDAPLMVETVQMVPTATPTMVETVGPMMAAAPTAMPAMQMAAPAMVGEGFGMQAMPAMQRFDVQRLRYASVVWVDQDISMTLHGFLLRDTSSPCLGGLSFVRIDVVLRWLILAKSNLGSDFLTDCQAVLPKQWRNP